MKVTKAFVDYDVLVFKVSNIRFLEADGSDASKQIRKIKDVSQLHEQSEVAYVRAILFYNKDMRYDFDKVPAGSYEKDIAIRQHEKRDWQPFDADSSDDYKKFEKLDDYYTVEFDQAQFVVLHTDYISVSVVINDDELMKRIYEQLIFEYLMNTMVVDIK
jgi:hypothetical protein